MSVNNLLENKSRLGQAHYLQKIKKAEDELNSAFNHLCNVVADTGIIATVQFSPEDKRFSVNLPLKRKADANGNDTTADFLEEICSDMGSSKPTGSIIGGVPEYCVNDVLQISVSGDPAEKINDEKISVSLITKPSSLAREGSKYSINFQGLNQSVIIGAGCSSEEQYHQLYYWVEPAVLCTMKSKLSEEVEILDQVIKLKTWVKDPKAKDKQAFNLFQEISDLLDVFKETLAKMTPGNQNTDAIRRMDGFLLYTEKVGFPHRYSDAIQDRYHTFDDMKKYFSLDSGVADVKVGLPVVKKYSQFKDIGSFLAWLYSFWGSASNQSFSGRAAAILCSKPKSGTLGKSGTILRPKPTGSKGKGKGKEASAKKTSSNSNQKEFTLNGSIGNSSKRNQKKGSKRKNN